MPVMKYTEFEEYEAGVTNTVLGKKKELMSIRDRYFQLSGMAKKKTRKEYKIHLEDYIGSLKGFLDNLRGRMPHLTEQDVVSPRDLGPLQRDQFGTYEIICPYCLARYNVGDLLFRASVVDNGSGDYGSSFPNEADERYEQFWRNSGRMGVNANRPHILRMDPLDKEINDVVFLMRDGRQSPPCPYNDETRAYMRGGQVVFMHDKFGHVTSTRICPNCHTELPNDIGFTPNYLFTLIGNSGCGKTVYINRLVLSLTGGQLPGYFGSVVNDEATEKDFTIREEAKRVFEINGQPMNNATDVGYIRPVIVQMINTTTRERFYITLFDFPGEGMWHPDNGFFVDLAMRNFENSFGWMFMFDSGTLDFVYNRLPQNLRPFASDGASVEMKADPTEIMTQVIQVFCHGQNFTRPVAFILSKSDLLRTCSDQLQGQYMNTMPSFLLPAPDHRRPELADLGDMYRCDGEIRSLLAPTGITGTGDMFTEYNSAWFGFSATNVSVEDGVIPENAYVSGLRDIQPLQWLLYRWGQMSAEFDPNIAGPVLNWGFKFQTDPKVMEKMKGLEKNLVAEINSANMEMESL